MTAFTIDKVSWHTSVKGNTEPPEKIYGRFLAVAQFLDQHCLVRRPLLPEGTQITDNFAIKSDDLTEDGLQLMKKAYDKWLKAVDKGKSYADMSLFDRELLKIQGPKKGSLRQLPRATETGSGQNGA